MSSSSNSKPYVLIGGLIGGLVGIGVLFLVLIQSLEITVESGRPTQTSVSESTDSSVAEEAQGEIPSNGALDDPQVSNPAHSETNTSTPNGNESEQSNNSSPQTAIAPGDYRGALRVSNQTTHPIRVALLPRSPEPSEGQLMSYSEPIHWDFAPGEGASRGLLLAIPDRDLTLQSGDVLTAFAQDGSQRYWGPFVVGSTAFPQWNGEESEWALILRDDSQ